jgi:hypothetical protein
VDATGSSVVSQASLDDPESAFPRVGNLVVLSRQRVGEDHTLPFLEPIGPPPPPILPILFAIMEYLLTDAVTAVFRTDLGQVWLVNGYLLTLSLREPGGSVEVSQILYMVDAAPTEWPFPTPWRESIGWFPFVKAIGVAVTVAAGAAAAAVVSIEGCRRAAGTAGQDCGAICGSLAHCTQAQRDTCARCCGIRTLRARANCLKHVGQGHGIDFSVCWTLACQ